MSWLSNGNLKIQKTTVITVNGKRYTTAKGLASKLSDVISYRMMENFYDKNINPKKYGKPLFSKSYERDLKKYKENSARLRSKAYRRILPIISKLW